MVQHAVYFISSVIHQFLLYGFSDKGISSNKTNNQALGNLLIGEVMKCQDRA